MPMEIKKKTYLAMNWCFYYMRHIHTDAGVEFARLIKYWKGKQQEMESNFQSVYKPEIPTAKQRKARKNSKRVVHSNKELSSYAGQLTILHFLEIIGFFLLTNNYIHVCTQWVVIHPKRGLSYSKLLVCGYTCNTFFSIKHYSCLLLNSTHKKTMLD